MTMKPTSTPISASTPVPAAIPTTVPTVGTPTAPLPVLAVGTSVAPLHVEDELRARLDQAYAALPADKKGAVRLVIGMKGITLDASTKLGEHVVVIAQAGKDYSGDTTAGAEVRISWAP